MLGRSARTAAVVAVAMCLHASEMGLAQEPMRLGAEFQINTVTASDQVTRTGSIDLESNGDFVVVWASDGQDGSSFGIFGQRFASSGAKLGIEFQVSTYTLGDQTYPAVGADDDGDFVVAWPSFAQDGSNYGVFARLFSSSGSALATEFQVNSVTANRQHLPAVARDVDGDFVIAWSSNLQDGSLYGVFARRFSATGEAQGGEFQVNTHTPGDQRRVAIDLDEDGDFVVTWQSDGQDGSSDGVFGQRFDSLGARQGLEFQVNAYVTGEQTRPTVGLDADGDFAIAWSSQAQDGSEYGIFARRFDSTGAPRGSEMQVNVYETGTQTLPSLGIDDNGDFVVAWQSANQDGSGYGVFARHFRSSGIPTSGDLPVNTAVADDQSFPAIRADTDGDFIVAWRSKAQDGSLQGVFGQRFDVPAVLDIDGNGELTALTDGLLVLRFFFGFTGSTLTGGAVGPNCTRCDSATILPYLQSLT